MDATYAPSEVRDAVTINRAPSRTLTPRYSKSPLAVLQIATREVSVVPKTTAVSGLVQRAVALR